MSRYNLKYELLFHGDAEYTDISNLVDSTKTSVTRYLTGENLNSAIDSCLCSLQNRSLVNGMTQQDIVEKLLLAQETQDKVFFRLSDTANIFTGYVRPTLSQTYNRDIPSIVKLDIEDMSYLLDNAMSELFEYPSHIDNDGFYIFNPDDKEHSIVHQRLYAAGYADDQIDNSLSGIFNQIAHTSGKTDATRTYRDYIDTLLKEYGYVQYFNESGLWAYKKLEFDSLSVDYVRTDEWLSDNGLSVNGNDNEIDGYKLKWSVLDLLRDVRLYTANTSTADGEFTGMKIGVDDYYPKDSDIEDVWQEFKTTWTDIPYLNHETREENEDLSLLTAKNIRASYRTDEHIVLDHSDDLPEFEPTRARYRFHNTGDLIEKLFFFELYGDALIRNEIVTYTMPEEAISPKEYTSEFIFDADSALLLTSRLATWYTTHDITYKWSDLAPIDVGDIVQVTVGVVSTKTFVGSYTETYPTGYMKKRDITAYGMSEVQSEPLSVTRRISKTTQERTNEPAKNELTILFDVESIGEVKIH